MTLADEASGHGEGGQATDVVRDERAGAAAIDELFEEFSRNALFAGVVGADAENLRRAVEEETDEANGMYRGYAEQAAAVGDREMAERFEQLREGERRLRDAFLAALHGLGDRQGSARP